MVAVRIPSSPPLSSSSIFFSLFLPQTSSNFSFVSSPRTSSGSRWGLSRSSRGGRCKGSAENEQTQFEIDPERAREALKKLDQQFQTLSQKQAVLPKKNMEPTNDMPTSSYTDPDRAMKAEDLPELFIRIISYIFSSCPSRLDIHYEHGVHHLHQTSCRWQLGVTSTFKIMVPLELIPAKH